MQFFAFVKNCGRPLGKRLGIDGFRSLLTRARGYLHHDAIQSLRDIVLTDDIIRLRYVEIDGQLRKIIVVIKMRGSNHSKDIREYVITGKGLVMLEPRQADVRALEQRGSRSELARSKTKRRSRKRKVRNVCNPHGACIVLDHSSEELGLAVLGMPLVKDGYLSWAERKTFDRERAKGGVRPANGRIDWQKIRDRHRRARCSREDRPGSRNRLRRARCR